MATYRASSDASLMMFTHGTQTYTLRQYCEIYKDAFPSFLMVTQGYYGEHEMEILGSGQVLRIHSCVYQKRAVAVDSQNRTLSIPTNYPLMFKIVNANNKAGKEEDSLCNILAKKPLPVKVQISTDKEISFSLTNAIHNVHTLGILTVEEVYEETYFLANAVSSNGSPSKTALLIPLYLSDILVSPIHGVEGKTESEWQKLQSQITEACKRVEIPLNTGLTEIALYSPQSIKSSDNVYDYIEPSSYIVAKRDGKMKSDESLAVTEPRLRKATKPPRPPKPLPYKTEERPPKLPERKVRSLSLSLEQNKAIPSYQNMIGRIAVAPYKETMGDDQKVARNDVKVMYKPVDTLTIEELGERLKDLKLEKYINSFKENGVDGGLAIDLNEKILKEDFNFTRFETLKFLKFVQTGHVPK